MISGSICFAIHLVHMARVMCMPASLRSLSVLHSQIKVAQKHDIENKDPEVLSLVQMWQINTSHSPW